MTVAGRPPFIPIAQQHVMRPAEIVDEILPIRRGLHGETPTYSSGHEQGYIIDDPKDLMAARRAVADTYLYKRYITPDQVDSDGYISAEIDPHVEDSVYFGFGRDGSLAATARLIHKDKLEKFPAISEFDIDVRKLEELDLDPSKFSEISALAKVAGVGNSQDILSVYAQMMRYSLQRGERYWLMSADTHLVGRLGKLFGKKSFTQLGDAKEYMGSETVPMAMDIYSSLKLYNKWWVPSSIKKTFTENLRNMDVANLGEREQKILRKHGVIGKNDEEVSGPKITPERVGMAGLVAYALARAVPVTALDEYGVNPWVFLGIDLATIPPYVMATSKMVRSKDAKSALVGGAVASASFAAPYAYLGIDGQEMPPLPAAVIAAYMCTAGVMAYRRTKKQIHEQQEADSSVI